jgi:hypothetical protein
LFSRKALERDFGIFAVKSYFNLFQSISESNVDSPSRMRALLLMIQMKFGIEAEYGLLRPDGSFADYTNTDYSEVRSLLKGLPDYRNPELRVGDAGIRTKNWYVEGDERFDERGRSVGFAVKGVEIRTPVFATIEDSMASLSELRLMLEGELNRQGWSIVPVAFNPCTASYEPEYTPWEKELQASHIGHSLPQVSTLSYGPDFNFSRHGESPEAVVEKVRRLTYYSPYIVPFSFSSPFLTGALWEGLSYRTYARTGPRPAALAHLLGERFHPLMKEADPASQHGRIEFKAFDMVSDDRLLAELFCLVFGMTLADAGDLPGVADVPDGEAHRKVALCGFEDDVVHEETGRIVGLARAALRANGCARDFPLLEDMLATRRTPAHALRERFQRFGFLVQRQGSNDPCGFYSG